MEKLVAFINQLLPEIYDGSIIKKIMRILVEIDPIIITKLDKSLYDLIDTHLVGKTQASIAMIEFIESKDDKDLYFTIMDFLSNITKKDKSLKRVGGKWYKEWREKNNSNGFLSRFLESNNKIKFLEQNKNLIPKEHLDGYVKIIINEGIPKLQDKINFAIKFKKSIPQEFKDKIVKEALKENIGIEQLIQIVDDENLIEIVRRIIKQTNDWYSDDRSRIRNALRRIRIDLIDDLWSVIENTKPGFEKQRGYLEFISGWYYRDEASKLRKIYNERVKKKDKS